MKTLMCGALCAAIALGGASVFAEDDFGIESASPTTIADPVNPQPGMVANAYYFDWGHSDNKYRAMTSSIQAIKKLPSVVSFVDKGDAFAKTCIQEDIKAHTIMWEGYIRCKRAAIYTFTFATNDGSYSFFANGNKFINDTLKQESCDVSLKVGWNHIVILAYFDRRSTKLTVNYKPKGSLSEPRAIAPKDLFHDQKPEEDW